MRVNGRTTPASFLPASLRSAALLSAAVLAALAWIGPAHGQGPADDWRIERLERTWPLPETAAVRVDNPLGSLWVRTHKDGEVYLLAHVQRHRDDPRELDLQLVQRDEELSIEVSFTDAQIGAQIGAQTDDQTDSASQPEPEAWTKRRVDLTVFVPPATATRFSTRTGLLEVRGTRGPTQVETSSGEIKLRVHGAATARTENGDVLAQFLGTNWDRAVEITSTTGAIRVEMPRGGNAGVVVETRGEITSDFSTEIERVADSLLKRARLTVGENGQPMRLTSHQGPIKILQSLVSAEDDGD